MSTDELIHSNGGATSSCLLILLATDARSRGLCITDAGCLALLHFAASIEGVEAAGDECRVVSVVRCSARGRARAHLDGVTCFACRESADDKGGCQATN